MAGIQKFPPKRLWKVSNLRQHPCDLSGLPTYLTILELLLRPPDIIQLPEHSLLFERHLDFHCTVDQFVDREYLITASHGQHFQREYGSFCLGD